MKLFNRNKQERKHIKKNNSDISEKAFEKCIEEVKKETPTVIQPFDSRLHLKEDKVREIRQKIMNGKIHTYPLITMNTSRFCTKIQDLLYEYYKDTKHTLDEDIHKTINFKPAIKLILIDYDVYKIEFKSIQGNWYSCVIKGTDIRNITDIEFFAYINTTDQFKFLYIIESKDYSHISKPYFSGNGSIASIEHKVKELCFTKSESNE